MKQKRLIACVALALSACAGHAQDPFDVSDPEANIEAWVKLEGDTGGRTFYQAARGTAYGIPTGDFSEPLFGFVGITKKAFNKLDGGGYEFKYFQCGVYTDYASGVIIDALVNPYTQEELALKPFCANISGGRLTPSGGLVLTASFAMESTIFNRPYLLEWSFANDLATVRRVAHTKWQEPVSEKVKYEMTIDQYTAPVKDLMDPTVTSINAVWIHNLQTEWSTFLNMGDRPGGLMWNLSGTKHYDPSELPQDVVAKINEHRPGIFESDIRFD